MIEHIWDALPGLRTLDDHPLLKADGALESFLLRLLHAHAPRAGCALPGGIGTVIGEIAAEYGLADRFTLNFAGTGNAALDIGAANDQPDIVIVAHMDRPSFRVRDAAAHTIYPVCALRLPAGGYECAAKAIRWDANARSLIVASRGMFTGYGTTLHYHTAGDLRWTDTIVMEAEQTLIDGLITGTGLDNSLGVAAAFGAAVAFQRLEADLIRWQRRILFVFSDEEEGIPDVFFGHGAARLAQHIRPVRGAIICDAHTAGDTLISQVGNGASHGVISGQGKGALVALNGVALAVDLAASLNQTAPGTVQLNSGYLSRSDDMGMARWTRILGMIGVPMHDPHTAHETALVGDVEKTIRWLTQYTAACLGVSPALVDAYALHP
ncbi:MAG: M20/M25/M40 family metallo-hydrolase [bacterium]|nr:M20/M25/M40 family metallo-hydrolase [bacterium]